jgi:hypothetical protein
MHHRSERILLETDRFRITGSLTLPRDGYRSRMSDFLNSSERDFISLTDVVMEAVGGDGSTSNHDYIAVARRHIVFALPMGPAPGEPGDEQLEAIGAEEAREEPEVEAPERPEGIDSV